MFETHDVRLQDFLWARGFVPVIEKGTRAEYMYSDALLDALDRYYIRKHIFQGDLI